MGANLSFQLNYQYRIRNNTCAFQFRLILFYKGTFYNAHID